MLSNSKMIARQLAKNQGHSYFYGRNLLFGLVIIISSTGAIAQSEQVSQLAKSKMLEAYSAERVGSMQNNNPALYEYLMSTAVYEPLIIKGVEPKYEDHNDNDRVITKNKQEISLVTFYKDLQKDDFNLLNYSVKPGTNSSVFKIDTGVYVVIESQAAVINKYKSK